MGHNTFVRGKEEVFETQLLESSERTAGRGAQSTYGLLIAAYVRLLGGEVFLTCILDLSSRICIGQNLSRRIDVQLPRRDLEMVLAHLQVSAGLNHHSDRGRKYCRNGYVE